MSPGRPGPIHFDTTRRESTVQYTRRAEVAPPAEYPVSVRAGVDTGELARWLAEYPVSGGPRSDQLSGWFWFDLRKGSPKTAGKGAPWKTRWPLHRAAMRGEVEAIHRLCSAGQDPNSKMTDCGDEDPVGWAARYGQLGAVVALIQCGADPFRAQGPQPEPDDWDPETG